MNGVDSGRNGRQWECEGLTQKLRGKAELAPWREAKLEEEPDSGFHSMLQASRLQGRYEFVRKDHLRYTLAPSG